MPENTEPPTPKPPATVDGCDEWFRRMYQRHPKHRDRALGEQECAKLWARFTDPVFQSAEIERVHALWCETESWRERNGQFAPTLARWLDDKGWITEPTNELPKSRLERLIEQAV